MVREKERLLLMRGRKVFKESDVLRFYKRPCSSDLKGATGRAHAFYLRTVKLLLSEQRSWGHRFESDQGRSKSL